MIFFTIAEETRTYLNNSKPPLHFSITEAPLKTNSLMAIDNDDDDLDDR